MSKDEDGTSAILQLRLCTTVESWLSETDGIDHSKGTSNAEFLPRHYDDNDDEVLATKTL